VGDFSEDQSAVKMKKILLREIGKMIEGLRNEDSFPKVLSGDEINLAQIL
jgi:hypothetical protein